MADRVNADTSNDSHSQTVSVLLKLIEDYHSFNPSGKVPVLPYPTPLEFSKQVSRGRPCVYRLDPDDQPARNDEEDEKVQTQVEEEMKNVSSCPAFSWTRQKMCEKVKEDVEVAVTPDGRADSLYRLPRARNQSRRRLEPEEESKSGSESKSEDEEEEVFVQPATINISLSSLFDKILIPQDDNDDDDDEAEEETTTPDRVAPTSTRTQSTNLDRRHKRQKYTKQYYLQSQNSNLTATPLSPLLGDLPRDHLPFARPVLGEPEAVNIWIGGSESVTSTHRDPFENLYLVLKGRKIFTLYPPVEELCLHSKTVRTGRHVLVDGGEDDGREKEEFEIVMDDGEEKMISNTDTGNADVETDDDKKIPWIPIDPDTINSSPPATVDRKYPHYRYSHPLTVTVWEGEILYLPSGWFHHVRQECGVWDGHDNDGEVAPCIAVNYWYDMDYEGEKYATREMMTRLVETVRREEQR